MVDLSVDLSAPCGLYCGACPLYKAEHDEGFRKLLAGKMKVDPDKARCPGCRPALGSVTPVKGKCKTYACAESKNIGFCYQCSEFPCNSLAPCSDRAQTIPHNFKIYSLLLLKKMGRETWEDAYTHLIKKYFKGRIIIGAGPEIE